MLHSVCDLLCTLILSLLDVAALSTQSDWDPLAALVKQVGLSLACADGLVVDLTVSVRLHQLAFIQLLVDGEVLQTPGRCCRISLLLL